MKYHAQSHILQAVIEARENRILELVAQNEQKEAEMHRLMAELRDLHSKQQKAPVTPVRKRNKKKIVLAT